MRLSLRRVPKHLIIFTLLFLTAVEMSPAQPSPATAPSFESFLLDRNRSVNPKWDPEKFCPVSTNLIAARVLREYGSIFAATDAVTLPPTCIFNGESDVLWFQKNLKKQTVETGGIRLEFQLEATKALQKAIDEAAALNLSITPLDGAIAGSRSYGDTLRLWNGRFFSALDYWTRQGKLTEADRDTIIKLDLEKRVEKIIEWETAGVYFSTDKTRSIFSSVASPGASQHLSMIAFDVVEYGRPEVRAILNQNGWFQTVIGDPPHFTYLGLPESELPMRGLRAVYKGSQMYWIPNMSAATN